MHLKDYYGILGIEPSATILEIKKAYRKLAQQYHPDKHNNDPYSSAQFAEMKEAYEVLTNPAKKNYYLQQRWYEQSTGKRKKQETINPLTVLKQALELERYVSTLDLFRMDKDGLKEYILALIPDSTIEKLKSFQEPETINEIIHTLIKATQPLPKTFTDDIITQLQKLATNNEAATRQIAQFVLKADAKNRREKYSLIIIIAVTAVVCLIIWLAGR